ncbi:MAG: crotonase/enoyl-CoA hydratase family protein [Candidatus Lokiarchaeota archaeon]|nr:crotonase/enoyl-CoA hydratase family protein [Candidatus Lokiarchaeota archaeon]
MTIRIEKDFPVFTIIIDNPEVKNAIDRITANELTSAFIEFENEEKALVAVLWGANGTFCSGANLSAIATEKANRVEIDGDGPMGPTRMRLAKPVIAAVAGYAVAGGLELAIWCDMRVVEEDAVFGVFCRRFGVPLIDGGTVRLPRLIGLSRAMDMILTGRPVYAKEALAWGLANRVVEIGQSRIEAEKLAREIATFPQTCMRNDRLSTYEQFGFNIKDAMVKEFEYGLITLESGEFLEGSQSFIQGKGKHGNFKNL